MSCSVLEEHAASVLVVEWEQVRLSTLKMEAASFYRTLVPIYESTWHHITADSNLDVQYRDNLESYTVYW